MDACEEQRSAQPELRHLVTMRPRDPLNEAVQAEPHQVTGHPAGGDGFGLLPGERGDLLAPMEMSETARPETKQSQVGP